MNSYLIFVIILTVIYLIYYVVNILRDLYAKPKSKKNDVEVIAVENDENDSVEVSENEDGFSIGKEKYIVNYNKQKEGEATEQQPAPVKLTQESVKSELEKKKEEMESKLKEVPTTLEDSLYAEDLHKLMLSKDTSKNFDMRIAPAMNFVPAIERL